ncbi:MAG TPA: OmpH family outer membrane protein [Candidatus Acidoferrales bacterium]|nr:OmpH family outer membrane protein [Candidatus Acidoferrales bacterium]
MSSKFARFIPVLILALAVPMIGQTTSAASAPAATAAPAAPAGTTPNKVGIIDIQQAIIRCNEGQRDFEALAKKFDPTRTELEASSKEVEDLKKRLQTTQDKLSDDARNNLIKEIDSKSKQLQRKYEDSNNDFQAQQNEIAQRIGQKMMQTVDKYSKENGYIVVLDVAGQQSNVLWAAPAADITQPVIEAYNAVSGVPAPAKPAATAPKPSGATAPAAKPASPVAKPPAR